MLGFRLEKVAVAADIEEMFLQVKVDPCDRGALKFLWWENYEFFGEPTEFQWASHPFGATSSPFCATFALRKTVEEFGSDYATSTCSAIDNNLYVDDCLKSLPDSVTAKCFVNEISALLSKGGFRMRNWSSNDRGVLSAIDPTELTSGVRNLTTDPLPMERALGVQWDTESDTLVIVFNLPTKPPTRRGVLSCISSLYDPLGFVSPWLIPGKCLLQSLCKGGLGWDEPLNDADRTRWDSWLSNLRSLHTCDFLGV
ncbi:hypothetical protein CLF_108975 [Clonorchis sinensis]|uniref:Reverse transcriptase domain-containing protein n=1 Tax=Clonorchis sinensis TaxID=79923 RepID=G7YIS8_CLOSI|nr:hypothetical protein CLF_108975 [Clonorchis sinensis]